MLVSFLLRWVQLVLVLSKCNHVLLFWTKSVTSAFVVESSYVNLSLLFGKTGSMLCPLCLNIFVVNQKMVTWVVWFVHCVNQSCCIQSIKAMWKIEPYESITFHSKVMPSSCLSSELTSRYLSSFLLSELKANQLHMLLFSSEICWERITDTSKQVTRGEMKFFLRTGFVFARIT